MVLPVDDDAERLVAARAEVLLTGAPDSRDDPVGHVLAIAELVRLGELAGPNLDPFVPELAAAVHQIARQPGWDVDAALAAATFVLARADEARAVRDVSRIRADRPGADPPPASAAGIRDVAAIERGLARDGAVLPDGIPTSWRGANIEAHGLPIGPRSTLSFAVRWHGEHPAVLWQVDGDPVELTAPVLDRTWRTNEPSGETLWRLAG
jgi:hypothetical protein